MTVCVSAPDLMEPIQAVKSKDSSTLVAEFNLQTGATNYIIRIQDASGFFREDTVASSPAELQYLTPYTEYMLSIMAANSAGRSQPSLSVTAKTGTAVCHNTSSCYVSSLSLSHRNKSRIQWQKQLQAVLRVKRSHAFMAEH